MYKRQNHTWVQHNEIDFAAWSKNGVSVSPIGGGRVKIELQSQKDGALACQSEDIDGGAAKFDAATGLCAGTDPMPSGLPTGVTYYNGCLLYTSRCV